MRCRHEVAPVHRVQNGTRVRSWRARESTAWALDDVTLTRSISNLLMDSFDVSSWHQGPILESTRLNLHWERWHLGRRGRNHEHLFRAATLWIVSPLTICPYPFTDEPTLLHQVSSAGIAGAGRETRCDIGRSLRVRHRERCSTQSVAACALTPPN